MTNDITNRFIEAYNTLVDSGQTSDKKDFADRIGVSSSMITEISKGRSNVGVLAIQNIVSVFSVSSDWLLTGKGSMFKDGGQSDSINAKEPDNIANDDIPDIDTSNLETAPKEELINTIKQLVEVNNRNSINLEKMILTTEKMADTADRNSITLSRLVDVLYGEGVKGGNQELGANVG